MAVAIEIPETDEGLTSAFGMGPAASRVYGQNHGLAVGGYGECWPLKKAIYRKHEGVISTLCAGCGHDSITAAIIQAVFELAEVPCRPVEEALLTALEDRVDYVQTAAIGTLAEMDAKWTIPNLIGKLKDKNEFIREAAILALEKLVGRPLGIDAESSNSKVLAKVRELEKWWKDNEKRILG